ncbi:MAG: HAD-IIB family hydrolase [Deltaproteobacteria bacterium]|nr:HAD-IIB family hydrolase [Deltaproteobacteria bacterium]
MNFPAALIFSDLDGSLLDHVSYSWDEAKNSIDLCRRYRIPIVLVSSKTRNEMEIIRRDIGLSAPFISENGGGIFFPDMKIQPIPQTAVFTDGLWKYTLGVPHETVLKALREIREELGMGIHGFSDMTPDEIGALTGLDPGKAKIAADREFDEPFIILDDDPDLDQLHNSAGKRGLKITEGGRFYHLHGKYDKGDAVNYLILQYRSIFPDIFTIALGDSPNDFSMFKKVEQPVLIRSSRGFPEIEKVMPGIKVTAYPGPKGWNSAVLEILNERIEGGIANHV